ncbi:hypothetical protein L313_1340 [Acinetobacter haemolyticus CIP 64.3 = MTCC 9819]|uniref:Uncharacterized protein n=1 Tax=Acinetobacter haemolyticus ATCC 19194 TaxID=707232 RepID=D4XNH8_ACIHA|nr:hypothetical protein HMPREF0023_1211 [Acinetobacter sp. ATCC 27244]EFF83252.1 hypothetical protein HMP0015_1270 [Acinetobacter haemolyticus ATCC 19194]EPR89461.1 hypothetical protein L313_1340 [Acinetobacter haemolyticus CIP 64.3 = MTCC 9819]
MLLIFDQTQITGKIKPTIRVMRNRRSKSLSKVLAANKTIVKDGES